jgi:TatD DNase family protein
MGLVDTHCHVDLYDDYKALISECEADRIATIAVTNTPSVFRRYRVLLAGHRFLRPALGLHPELAHQRFGEIGLLKELITDTRYIGEIGLDFVTTDADVRAIQVRVFEAILTECAASGNKVLTIHSRRAAQEVVDRIGIGFPSKVILHWFSGNVKVLHRALENGYYFSINTAMVESDSGRRLITHIPPDRVLTESDGPFINVGGQPARPRDVRAVITQLATIWDMDGTKTEQTIWHNFREIVSPMSRPL